MTPGRSSPRENTPGSMRLAIPHRSHVPKIFRSSSAQSAEVPEFLVFSRTPTHPLQESGVLYNLGVS
jgi:hypothetical protein